MVQVIGKRIKYYCSLSNDHYIGIVCEQIANNPRAVFKVQLLNNNAMRYIGEGQIIKIYKDGEIIPEQHEGNGN